jgi:hypothetical protein
MLFTLLNNLTKNYRHKTHIITSKNNLTNKHNHTITYSTERATRHTILGCVRKISLLLNFAGLSFAQGRLPDRKNSRALSKMPFFARSMARADKFMDRPVSNRGVLLLVSPVYMHGDSGSAPIRGFFGGPTTILYNKYCQKSLRTNNNRKSFDGGE